MLYWFLLYSKVNRAYFCIHPLFSPFPSHVGHHWVLSTVPCAIYVSPNLPIHPTSTYLRGNHSLHLWLYFFFASSFIFTTFLDSTCKRYLFFSFWLTSLCLTVTRFIHISANGAISFLFYGWLIFHHIYVPHEYIPFKGAQACIYTVCQKGHWNHFHSCSDNY